jgi:hypothetical protein
MHKLFADRILTETTIRQLQARNGFKKAKAWNYFVRIWNNRGVKS